MLRINEKSLEWALKNIEKYGDTDIFPTPFEFNAIRFNWDVSIKRYLKEQNLLDWTIRPSRRTLTPKHRFGFRIATQLDPLDSIVFNSLVYEIGADIERCRVPKKNNIVFSSRFLPKDDGQMFDPNYNWIAFQRQSTIHVESNTFSYVVLADIADFFPRIYSHPLENALDMCTTKNNHIKKIKSMLKDWNYSISYGIPVGPISPRLLAELAINDIDQCLISQNITYCRFVDDFRIFCTSEVEAHKNLAYLANILFENHGLTLQQHKTRILSTDVFQKSYLKSEDDKELDNLSNKYYDILESVGIESVYEEIEYFDLSPDIQEEIDNLNLIDILKEQIHSDKNIDNRLVAFILNRLGQLNNPVGIDLIINNIDKLYTVFKNIFIYVNCLTCISKEQKSDCGKKMIDLIGNSIVGHLEYHRAWLFDTFANDKEWNNAGEYMNLYDSYTDEFSRRKIILALGISNSNSWFKTKKRYFDSFSPWSRRAFLAAASCLPGDEADHWYRSIKRKLDPLEDAIVEWALKNRYGK